MAMQFRYYGYYAGPGWTGGYYLPPGVDVAEYYNVDPKSGTDAAARAHDWAYGNAQRALQQNHGVRS